MPEKIKDTNIRNAAKALINDNKKFALDILSSITYLNSSLIEEVLKIEYRELGGNLKDSDFMDFCVRNFHYNDGIMSVRNARRNATNEISLNS